LNVGFLYDLAGVLSYDFNTRELIDDTGSVIIQYLSTGINFNNKLTKYNSDTTAGNGVAYIKHAYNPTGLTTVINNNYTTSAAAGQYRISLASVITGAWTTGTMDVILSWNNGTAKTKTIITALSMTTIGNEDQYVGTFDVSASTTINITTNFTTATGSGTYRIKSIIERVG
jgi:hypothetical protein